MARHGLSILAAGLTLSGLALADAARAEVVASAPGGFESRQTVTVAVTPAKARAAFVDIAGWWDERHTYSGSAANLSLDANGGCFCERLPAGMVRHMSVVYANPEGIRLEGALGPLQELGVAGHLTVIFKPAEGGGTQITARYVVGGYAPNGLGETWAAPVDQVLGIQFARLKAYAERAN